MSNGQRKETQYNVFQIPNMSQEHWTFLDLEMKRNGVELKVCSPEGRWDSTVTQMAKRLDESGHPVFKRISALSRGILKRKNTRDTVHFNADASNTVLSNRTIHLANQLSIYGAVACWCEESALKPDETSERLTKTENLQTLNEERPQEVNSLVQTPRNDEPASGNGLRECIQIFETLEKEISFTKICENATLFHRVSVGMWYKTVADVDWWLLRSNSGMQSSHALLRTRIPESVLPFQNEQ